MRNIFIIAIIILIYKGWSSFSTPSVSKEGPPITTYGNQMKAIYTSIEKFEDESFVVLGGNKLDHFNGEIYISGLPISIAEGFYQKDENFMRCKNPLSRVASAKAKSFLIFPATGEDFDSLTFLGEENLRRVMDDGSRICVTMSGEILDQTLEALDKGTYKEKDEKIAMFNNMPTNNTFLWGYDVKIVECDTLMDL